MHVANWACMMHDTTSLSWSTGITGITPSFVSSCVSLLWFEWLRGNEWVGLSLGGIESYACTSSLPCGRCHYTVFVMIWWSFSLMCIGGSNCLNWRQQTLFFVSFIEVLLFVSNLCLKYLICNFVVLIFSTFTLYQFFSLVICQLVYFFEQLQSELILFFMEVCKVFQS